MASATSSTPPDDLSSKATGVGSPPSGTASLDNTDIATATAASPVVNPPPNRCTNIAKNVLHYVIGAPLRTVGSMLDFGTIPRAVGSMLDFKSSPQNNPTHQSSPTIELGVVKTGFNFNQRILVNNAWYTVSCENLPYTQGMDDDYVDKVLVPQLEAAIAQATTDSSIKGAPSFQLELSEVNGLDATQMQQVSSTQSDGSTKTEWKPLGKTVRFSDANTIALCRQIKLAISDPITVEKMIVDKQWKQPVRPSSNPNPSNQPLKLNYPTKDLSPANAPIAFINHENQSCFLATMVWTLLLNNPYMLDKLKAATPKQPPAGPATEPAADQKIREDENRALDILQKFVARCETAKGTAPVASIHELRNVLHLLKPSSFNQNSTSQEDVHEAWNPIAELILKYCPPAVNLSQTNRTLGNGNVSNGTVEQTTGRVSIGFPDEATRRNNRLQLSEMVTSHLWPADVLPQAKPGTDVIREQTTLDRAYDQLEIHLNRYDALGRKIHDPVTVQLEMTLPGFHFKDNQDVKYQLYGTIIHRGETAKHGHYTSLLRVPENGAMRDIKADDKGNHTPGTTCDMVEITDQNYEELAKQGYMFVYRKVDAAHPAVPPSDFANRPAETQPANPPSGPDAFSRLTPEQQRFEIFQETRLASQNQLKELTDTLRITDLDTRVSSTLGIKNASAAPTPVYVLNATTKQATQQLVQNGWNPSALVMANAKTPGGGVQKGATAQEEIINRQSNAFEGLEQAQTVLGFYDKGGLQHGFPIHDVTFFRGDESENYESLEHPFQASLFFSAAIDLTKEKSIPNDYETKTEESIRHMFRQAILDGKDSLVLSAYGCGAFKGKFNDVPGRVAGCYRRVLDEDEFKDRFKVVVFAIVDDENGKGNFAAFTTGLNPTNGTLQTLPTNPTSQTRRVIPKVNFPIRTLKTPTPRDQNIHGKGGKPNPTKPNGRTNTKTSKPHSVFANRFGSSSSNTIDNYASLRRKQIRQKGKTGGT